MAHILRWEAQVNPMRSRRRLLTDRIVLIACLVGAGVGVLLWKDLEWGRLLGLGYFALAIVGAWIARSSWRLGP